MDSNEPRFTVIRDTYERINDLGVCEYGTEWAVWDNTLHTPRNWFYTRKEAQQDADLANRIWTAPSR